MAYKEYVTIVRTSDGATRVIDFTHEFPFDADKHTDFIWTEGNFSCDCNLQYFWADAGGGVRPDNDSGYCIGEGRFFVTSVVVVEADGTEHVLLQRPFEGAVRQ